MNQYENFRDWSVQSAVRKLTTPPCWNAGPTTSIIGQSSKT